MLHLTPDMLERGYELLRVTPPFRSWKLPEGDDIVFHATTIDRPGQHGTQGQHCFDGKAHHIWVNPKRHSTLAAMLMTMAHEMVHVRESVLALRTDVMHGSKFQRMADQVCRHQGFDRGQF